jgi:aarF domain-containing kinase
VDQTTLLRRWIRFLKRWWTNVWNTWLVASRITEVALRLSPLMILTPAAYISGSTQLQNLGWSYSLHAIHGLGPVAVKFCQWIATRRDIFPPTLCDHLSILHDQGFPHPRAYTHQVLTDAFSEYEQKGLEIDQVIGCGSAAQVYRGTLRNLENGSTRTVAVKVLHPNFSKMVDRDLHLIQVLAEALHYSLPSDTIRMLNLPRATEIFGNMLRLQADLTIEASNLQRLRSNFYQTKKDEERSKISFPQPIPGWKSKNVLVEDFVHDAVPISDFLKDSTPEGLNVRRELAGPLLRAFLKMVFMDNFVHGDLHPGNVMVKTTTMAKEESWLVLE